MDFLWDTNILLHRIRQSVSFQKWEGEHHFFDKGNRNFISIVSVGEIHSLALQRNWGMKKMKVLGTALDKLSPLVIAKRSVVQAYATIDAYSQNKLASKPLPLRLTSRNMGKNDLWIAATTHVINARLVTTDHDFDHLDGQFLKLLKVSSKPLLT